MTYIRKKCEHGKQKYKCVDCGGTGVCEHRKDKYICIDCGGKGVCEHGRRHSNCKDCRGINICEHNRRRARCKECGGNEICEHCRVRSSCIDCGGKQICSHRRVRSKCRDCGGSQICPHKRTRTCCGECGGFEAIAKRIDASGKHRSKKFGLPYELTREWILSQLKNGCPVFKQPFNCVSRGPSQWSATLDKFKPELGYTKENSHIISNLANRIKNSATSSEQVFKVVEWMRNVEECRGDSHDTLGG